LFLAFALLILNITLGGHLFDAGASIDSTDEEGSVRTKDPNLKAELIFEGLDNPTAMAFLGPDDILVLDKDKGTVNGDMQEEPLVDLDVANKVERGLLGIAVAKETQPEGGGDKNEAPKTYVFLYLTESSDKEDGTDMCEKKNFCTSGDPIGHRLYRYELKGNQMINPQLLLDLPANPGADHVGGALVLGPDKNVYLITGDGDSCEYDSCKDSIDSSVINAQTANVENGDPPEGRGGILRITQDGRVVGGKGILGDDYPLNLYYAYGIRNSLGLDFDSVTGNLWDTENGPGFGDEINLVKPGFNSGWHMVQGIWPITSSELLDPTPEEKGYPDNNEISEAPDDLVDFNHTGKYSNPELTWNIPKGITAIKFLNSDKLGKQYENDLFVGLFLGGTVYHFDLNEDRTQLDLQGLLSDKVVDRKEDLEDAIFAEGFQGIVDIEVSPDGYLYVLSYDGTIHRIVHR
jgi:glucose/arabinose dehydrogenase